MKEPELLTGGRRVADWIWLQAISSNRHLLERRTGMRLAQEEVFGPVLAVIPFNDEDEVVRMAKTYEVRSGGDTLDTRHQTGAHDRSTTEAGNVTINYPNRQST